MAWHNDCQSTRDDFANGAADEFREESSEKLKLQIKSIWEKL
jgi:hypothetical protein